MEFLQQMDIAVLLFIQEHLRTAALNGFFLFITRFGEAGKFWDFLALALMLPKKTRKAGMLSYYSLALGVLISNVWLKNLVCRPRPFALTDALLPLGRCPGGYSFPSGHTCLAFSCALIYVRLLPKKFGVPLVVLAAFVGLSRLYLGVHYPTDVLGGFLVALLASETVYVCCKWLEGKGLV